jgi:ABC-type lipoprotein export system ATPase subunit
MALLTLDSVVHSYVRGSRPVSVLSGVSLDVHAGGLIGVYGQRRSGKTTLLKIAAGFERPVEGVVRYQGTALDGLSRDDLAHLHREQIAWVERAAPHVAELTAVEYVAMPLYGRVPLSRARRRAFAALDAAGAAEHASQSWREISDMGRTLVAIAHALVRDPRVVLVDGPTARLGVVEREHVIGLLRAVAEEREIGVVLAVPDTPSLLHVSEVRLLSRGRLIAPAEPPPPEDANVIDFARYYGHG